MAVLQDHLNSEQHDLIGISDEVVTALLKGGVLIPEWMPMPFDGGKPAQGYYPTASRMEKWEGRKVTPKTSVSR